ncbi:MAG: MMPL family transporter [Deltaproteobacteria bacterium]|nr:MMPL family transporter [Deltaproteobacteria bacterium]
MKRFAELIIDKRLPILVGIILLTGFFLYMAVTRLTVKTVFHDLLPQNHAYVNVHNEIRNTFGGANQAYIMVQVRDREDGGKYDDVFNYETLGIVKNITVDLLRFHGVDRFKIMSLASNQVKTVKMSSAGMAIRPVMYPRVPTTPEGLEELRDNVYGTPMCYPGMVSLDSKKSLITVDFFEEEIDYRISFKEFRALRDKYEDENHIIAIAGEPIHLGYIDSYVGDVIKILAYTVAAMMAVFLMYFRSKRGMLLPIIAAAVSAVWGLGFMSLLGFNLDPLVLVFPFLIASMAASHSVQVIKRYKEEAAKIGDVQQACKSVVEHLFVPGFAGIVTDASGIIVIALTPIPILQKICLSCAFWAFATVVIAMVMVPILLSYMPIRTAKEGQGLLDRLLRSTGRWVVRRGKYAVLAVSLVLMIWGCTYINDVTIGNAVPGSEVLWPWHRYNVDSFRITFAMPMLNPLYIVVEGDEQQSIANPAVIRDILNFSDYMSRTPDMRVIFPMSVLGSIPGRNQKMRDNDLNWRFTPNYERQLMLIYRNIIDSAGPGSWDRFIDHNDQTTNVIIYCRDKTSETIKIVIDRVNDFIRNESLFGKRIKDVERKGFDKFIYWVDGFFRAQEPPIPEKPPVEGVSPVYYRLAGGAVGMQAAVNEALTLYQIWTFILALGTVMVLCTFIFRSFLAGVMIVVPLILSNVLAFAYMVLNPGSPLPLTTATLPVASVGIGLGVDYGIYLVSRIIEEYRVSGDLETAVSEALATTGKAIVFIATTLICGIAFWFLSKMMFQALMGLLLAIILLFNMLGALLIIPSFIAVFKPKFITRQQD